MEAGKRCSRGGFLPLSDCNIESQKKHFSTKPDLPGSPKQGKENLIRNAIEKFQFKVLQLSGRMNIVRKKQPTDGTNANKGIKERGSQPAAVKSRGLSLKFQDDQPDEGTSAFLPFGTPMIDNDEFGVLYEQKVEELSLLQTPEIVKQGSSPTSAMTGFLPHFDVVAKHDVANENWDFKDEAFEERVVIQEGILTLLIDEIVADLLSD